MTVIQARGGLGGAGITAAARLGQAERTQGGTTGQLRQPFPFLRLGTEPVDRHRTEGYATLQCDGHTLIDLAKFLECKTQGEVVAAHTAVLLREWQPEKTHIGHPGNDLVREGMLGIMFCGDGGDDLAGEIAHRLHELLVLVGQSSGGQECGTVFAH